MLRRLLTVVALVLLPVTAFAVLPRDFLRRRVLTRYTEDLKACAGK